MLIALRPVLLFVRCILDHTIDAHHLSYVWIYVLTHAKFASRMYFACKWMSPPLEWPLHVGWPDQTKMTQSDELRGPTQTLSLLMSSNSQIFPSKSTFCRDVFHCWDMARNDYLTCIRAHCDAHEDSLRVPESFKSGLNKVRMMELRWFLTQFRKKYYLLSDQVKNNIMKTQDHCLEHL